MENDLDFYSELSELEYVEEEKRLSEVYGETSQSKNDLIEDSFSDIEIEGNDSKRRKIIKKKPTQDEMLEVLMSKKELGKCFIGKFNA